MLIPYTFVYEMY